MCPLNLIIIHFFLFPGKLHSTLYWNDYVVSSHILGLYYSQPVIADRICCICFHIVMDLKAKEMQFPL